jgi:hypothetical protein
MRLGRSIYRYAYRTRGTGSSTGGPRFARPMMMEDPRILHVMNLYGETFYCEYDDVQSPWYGDSRG